MLPAINTSEILCDFAELYCRSFSTNLSQTWLFFGPLSSGVYRLSLTVVSVKS